MRTSRGLPDPGEYTVVNVDRTGFFRVEYDEESRGLILDHFDEEEADVNPLILFY